MGRKSTYALLKNGDALSAADAATYRAPTVPAAVESYVKLAFIEGPVKKVLITLTNLPITVADATQGVGTKLCDFLTGLYKLRVRSASLTFTTTSVILSTLNGSKTINWALGTVTQSTTTLLGTAESDILPVTAATSSATINVVNAATVGEQWIDRVLDGSAAAPAVYLNIAIPTSTDIDADATVLVNGTISIKYEDLGSGAAMANAARMPSASIWKNCPWDELNAGQLDGFTYWNDFVQGHYSQAANVAASATTIRDGGMCAFTGATAGGTVAPALDSPYGVVKLANTTDGETTILQALGNGNIAGQVVFEAGRRVWFEARVKVLNTTTNEHDIFVGFGEEGLAVNAGVITAADALTDKDLIGFNKLGAATTALTITHNTAGGGGVTNLATATTIAADTWANYGIVCDGTTVFFYKDGVQITSVLLSATNFPDGEEMAFYYALVAGSGGGDEVASIDWLKVAMQRG